MNDWREDFIEYFVHETGKKNPHEGPFLGQKICPFCGRSCDIHLMKTDSALGSMCAECWKDRVKTKKDYERILKKIILDFEILLGINYLKKWKISELRRVKIRESDRAVQENKFYGIIRNKTINGKLLLSGDGEQSNKYHLTIERGLPRECVIAEFSHAVLMDYLTDKNRSYKDSENKRSENGKSETGISEAQESQEHQPSKSESDGCYNLADWLMVHYLYLAGYKRLAREYDKAFRNGNAGQDHNGDGYEEWVSLLRNPLNEKIIWMDEVERQSKETRSKETYEMEYREMQNQGDI